jgi:hypothetical protein
MRTITAEFARVGDPLKPTLKPPLKPSPFMVGKNTASHVIAHFWTSGNCPARIDRGEAGTSGNSR